MAKATVVTVVVQHPEFYWLADRSAFTAFVDPDREDGKRRHSDREQIDWAAVAAAAEANGCRLVAGDTYIDSERDQVFDVDLSGLSDKEAQILRSWFCPSGLGPRGDPGCGRPGDGRHRLWCSWEAEPGALLPVYSALPEPPETDEEEVWNDVREEQRDRAYSVMTNYPMLEKSSPQYWQALQRLL